ncbi:hypothetical protein ACP9IA_000311 [Proteus mirabilis]|uniref:hypothetical protein n=1 Tax=Proteus mirabilis TaxID=584 RepID=UPI0038C158EC
MDEKYNRFVDETMFSRQLLGIGLTSLRKASFANRGLYFQALSSISLGLERLMKLCLLLDDYNKNGKYTSRKEMKDYGHNLQKLFKQITECSKKTNNLSDIHIRVLELLTEFAQSSRYSNVDFITNDHDNDPMKTWHNSIDKYIYEKILNDRQRNRIEEKCELSRNIGDGLPAFTIGYYDENRKPIDSVGELYSLEKRSEILAGYRTLLVINIIECIYKILHSMSRESTDPYFRCLELNRIFATITYGSDSEKIKRKDFNRMS